MVGVVVGYALKFLGDALQARWNASKDREARDDLRREKRYERRSAFQRETLLNLQEAAMDLARTTGSANHIDEMAHRSGTPWRETMLPSELDEKLRIAHVRTLMFASRVDNEQIRDAVSELKTYSAQATGTPERNDASRAMLNMAVAHEGLQDRIGTALRKIDHDESK